MLTRTLALLLSLALLCACGPGDPPADPPAQPDAGAATAEPADEPADDEHDNQPVAGLGMEEKVDADISDEPLTAGDGESLVAFKVDGMTCTNCAATVYESLSLVDGVLRTRVSYEGHTAWVVVDAKRAPSPEALIAAARAEGFKLTAPAAPAKK